LSAEKLMHLRRRGNHFSSHDWHWRWRCGLRRRRRKWGQGDKADEDNMGVLGDQGDYQHNNGNKL